MTDERLYGTQLLAVAQIHDVKNDAEKDLVIWSVTMTVNTKWCNELLVLYKEWAKTDGTSCYKGSGLSVGWL